MRKVNQCVKNCLKCNNPIPSSIVIDGKRRRLFPRNYCLTCSPWGSRNSRKLEIIRTDGLKTCTICKVDKELKEFSEGNGPCKPCYARKHRNERRAYKAKCVTYLGGACVRCGYSRCQAALDFHHRDPLQKDYTIGSQSWEDLEKIKPELDKCDLLCRNCHAEVHFNDIEANDAGAPSPSS